MGLSLNNILQWKLILANNNWCLLFIYIFLFSWREEIFVCRIDSYGSRKRKRHRKTQRERESECGGRERFGKGGSVFKIGKTWSMDDDEGIWCSFVLHTGTVFRVIKWIQNIKWHSFSVRLELGRIESGLKVKKKENQFADDKINFV